MKTKGLTCALMYAGIATILLVYACRKEHPVYNNDNDNDNNNINDISCGTITDSDGNTYNTILIGSQCWMKENLKTTKYVTGEAIGTTTPDTLPITGVSEPKYQWAYEGNATYATTYGRLYTWYAITDSRAVCPTGWHIPSDNEWDMLISFLGGDSVAGNKLKEAGNTHWYSNNPQATNQSGFTALPGGYRTGDGMFRNIQFYGIWWSATPSNLPDNAYDRQLTYNAVNVNRGNNLKLNGAAVRCVKDN